MARSKVSGHFARSNSRVTMRERKLVLERLESRAFLDFPCPEGLVESFASQKA